MSSAVLNFFPADRMCRDVGAYTVRFPDRYKRTGTWRSESVRTRLSLVSAVRLSERERVRERTVYTPTSLHI